MLVKLDPKSADSATLARLFDLGANRLLVSMSRNRILDLYRHRTAKSLGHA